MSTVGIGAAFVMGLFGGLHCVGMCGPVAALLCTDGAGRTRSQGTASLAVATNLGRIGTYAALGASVGALGGHVSARLSLVDAQLALRLLAAAALLLAGLRLTGILRPKAGRPTGRRSVLTGWLVERGPGRARAFVRGSLWGLLPCGLVYAALALALASGSAGGGALSMVAFGLGTLPAIVASIALAGRVTPWLKHASIRAVAGLLLMLSGSVHAAMAVVASGAIPVAEEVRPCCASRK